MWKETKWKTRKYKLKSFAFQLPSLNRTKASSFLMYPHISELCGFQFTRVRVVICMCLFFSFHFFRSFNSILTEFFFYESMNSHPYVWVCMDLVKSRFYSVKARFRSNMASIWTDNVCHARQMNQCGFRFC